MIPKFKVGDIVYAYHVGYKKYMIYKILDCYHKDETYKIYNYKTHYKFIMSFQKFESSKFAEHPPLLLTDDKKIELL